MTLRCFIILFVIGIRIVDICSYSIYVISRPEILYDPGFSTTLYPPIPGPRLVRHAKKDSQLIIIRVCVYVSWWSDDGGVGDLIWECSCECGIVGTVLLCVHCTQCTVQPQKGLMQIKFLFWHEGFIGPESLVNTFQFSKGFLAVNLYHVVHCRCVT